MKTLKILIIALLLSTEAFQVLAQSAGPEVKTFELEIKAGTTYPLEKQVGNSHLRLTLDARIAMKKYNTVGLTVGYVFGGGIK